jgi:surface polysaccharide O-acyltransferase-like enzyme
MAKKTTKRTVRAVANKTAPAKTELQDHHKAFSHIMYALFLISITFAAFYTFNALGALGNFANTEYFYPIVAILMLLWAFLFWEFGHRIHTV